MSISVMHKENRSSINRVPLIWLVISLGCIAITNIYALFGHGVRSVSMDRMFLYPLLGGALVYFLLYLVFRRFRNRRFWRLGCNLYNSGIATLTAGAMLRGILEIAGTASIYTPVFGVIGWSFIAAGICAVFAAVNKQNSGQNGRAS